MNSIERDLSILDADVRYFLKLRRKIKNNLQRLNQSLRAHKKNVCRSQLRKLNYNDRLWYLNDMIDVNQQKMFFLNFLISSRKKEILELVEKQNDQLYQDIEYNNWSLMQMMMLMYYFITSSFIKKAAWAAFLLFSEIFLYSNIFFKIFQLYGNVVIFCNRINIFCWSVPIFGKSCVT